MYLHTNFAGCVNALQVAAIWGRSTGTVFDYTARRMFRCEVCVLFVWSQVSGIMVFFSVGCCGYLHVKLFPSILCDTVIDPKDHGLILKALSHR